MIDVCSAARARFALCCTENPSLRRIFKASSDSCWPLSHCRIRVMAELGRAGMLTSASDQRMQQAPQFFDVRDRACRFGHVGTLQRSASPIAASSSSLFFTCQYKAIGVTPKSCAIRLMDTAASPSVSATSRACSIMASLDSGAPPLRDAAVTGGFGAVTTEEFLEIILTTIRHTGLPIQRRCTP